MDSGARKFIARAPRYTLRPTDNRFLRFAFNDNRKQSFTTHFIDISMSGLAFVIDREHAPHVSDIIKMEVPLGETETIAWWARVVRVEEYSPHKWYMREKDFPDTSLVKVAVTFHDLPAGHRLTIKRALDDRFTILFKEEKWLRTKQLAMGFIANFWQIFLYVGLTAATFWFIWYFSQPSATYDAKKGAPWGQRYPEFNIFAPREPYKDQAPETQ